MSAAMDVRISSLCERSDVASGKESTSTEGGAEMRKTLEKVKEEFLKLLPPTLFFFVTLHIVALIRSLMVRGTGIEPMTSLQVTIGALVLGKSVLIADMLPAMNRFPTKPLIYNVVWKTVIYMAVAAFLHYLENLIEFWRKADSFIAGNRDLLAKIIWPHFLALQLVLFVIIVMYVTTSELIRVTGVERAKRLFFGPLPDVESRPAAPAA
jgi:hypothetical protein